MTGPDVPFARVARLAGVLLLLAAAAPAQLDADFTATPVAGVNPLVVDFTDTTTGGTVVAWSWTFGDGGTSGDQHPQHTYTLAGSYTVSLTVFTTSGFDFVQKNDLITVTAAPLVADFSATPVFGVNPLQVAFTDTSTGGTTTGWQWDFGDGSTGTRQNPIKTYKVATTTIFTVTLTAFIGQQADTVVKTDMITVDPAPLVAEFSATPVSGVNPLVVAFTDMSSGATINGWLWEFGDGTISPLQDPIHQYNAPGLYPVALTVYVSPQSETIVKRDFITVQPAPLVVDFDASVTAGENPLTVAFTDLTSGGSVTGWNWDFGDGNTSTLQNPSHTFTLPGAHDVSLKVFVGKQSEATVKTGFIDVAHAPLGRPLFNARTYLAGEGPFDIATDDVDGDGAPDVLVVDNLQSAVTSLLGQGEGSLEFVGSFGVGSGPWDIALADFDGDGAVDVAMAETNPGQVAVLFGRGDGSFGDSALYTVGSWTRAVAAGDVDGDGDQDLVAAASLLDKVFVLLGDGAGGFTTGASYTMTGLNPEALALALIDGDAILDIVAMDVGSSKVQGQDITVLLGNGDGTFEFATGFTPPGYVLHNAMALADYDADGTLDIAASRRSPDSVYIATGQGDGSFVMGVNVLLPVGASPRDIATGDLNGDGLLDLVTADYGTDSVSVLPGEGAGAFEYGRSYGVGSRPNAVAIVDADGDGRLDVVTADNVFGTVTVLRGDGTGALLSNSAFAVGTEPVSVAVGDFDRDGVQDLATADQDDDTVSVLLGLGDGGFVSAATYPVGNSPGTVVAADFDADGVEDLAVAVYLDNEVMILLGQGDGSFMPRGPFATGSGPRDIGIGDFDGDETLDLVTIDTLSHTVSILLGLGDGGFSSAGTIGVGTLPSGVAVADYDDDGALDLAVSEGAFGFVTILSGDGAGGFVSLGSIPVGGGPVGIAAADLDTDGNPDLVTADFTDSTLSILWGLGGASFSPPESVSLPSLLPVAILIVDADGDGHLDLVTGGQGVDAVGVLLGDGQGGFADNGLFGAGAVPYGIAAGDFDGNGRTDIVTTNSSSDDVTVLLNQLDTWTNLASGLPGVAGIPYLAGNGTLETGSDGSVTLDKAAPLAPAILFASVSSTPSPFKCGTLVPVPALTSVSVQIHVDGKFALGWPSWPAGLSGQSIYLQYAVQDATAVCGASLSNALRGDVP
jgi:PKD repeat protein